jgi:hypothetical protein
MDDDYINGLDFGGYAPASNVPENVVNIDRTDGLGFGGILESVKAGANSLIGTWAKVYELQSTVENTKFNNTLRAAQLDVQRAGALGSLEVQRAQVDATKTIELARARRAVADAEANAESSSRAGFQYITNTMTKTPPIYLMLGLGAAFYYFNKK